MTNCKCWFLKVLVVVLSISAMSLGDSSFAIRYQRPNTDFEENLSYYLRHVIKKSGFISASVFMDCQPSCQDMAQRFIHKLGISVIIDNWGYQVADGSLFVLFEHKLKSLKTFYAKIGVVKYPTFIIMWPCPDCKVTNEGIKKHFEHFWKFNFTSVLAVVEQYNKDLKVFGFFPYSENHCGFVGPIREVALLNSSSKQVTELNTAHKQNVDNFFGCPLNIIVRKRLPDTSIRQISKNKYEYEGCGGLILKTAMKKLNFTADFLNVKLSANDSNDYNSPITDTEDVCCDILLNKSADMIVGTLTNLLYYDEPGIELTRSMAQECFLFYTPCGINSDAITLISSYSKAFSPSSWLYFFISVIFAMVTMLLIGMCCRNESSFTSSSYNILYLFGCFLNVSMPKKQKSSAMRILSAHVLFSFLIISVVFEAFVQSHRSTKDAQNYNIESVKEIEDLNLKIFFTPQSYKIWNNVERKYLNNDTMEFDIVRNGTVQDLVSRVALQRDSVVFGPQRLLAYYSYNRKAGSVELQDSLLCPLKPCAVRSFSSMFIFRKGSLLTEPINNMIQSLLESGIIHKWWSMKDPYVTRRFTAEVITLKDFLSAVYILTFGLILSVVVFFLEICCFCLWKKS